MEGRFLAAAAWVVALPSIAFARQEPVQAIAEPTSSPACVLHVWPSENARSSYMGWFHGGAVDGDRRGIKGYPAMHAEVLTTAVQQQLLTAIDWPKALSRPGLSVVVHEQPPAPRDDQTRTTPLIPDRPGCYQELLVHSVFVEKAALSSTSVRVMVIAKTWAGPNDAPSTYSAMANEKVDLNGQLDSSLKQGFVASVGKVLTAGFFQQH